MNNDIVVIADGSKRSKVVREELRKRGHVFQELDSTLDTVKDIEDAARVARTHTFFVVDSRYHIYDTFKFDYKVPIWDQVYIHVFRAEGTEEAKEKMKGYGGVRIFSKGMFHDGKLPAYNHDIVGAGGMKYVDETCGCYLSSKNVNIFFLRGDELNVDANYNQLLKYHPTAVPVRATGSIYESHKHLAEVSYTQLFAVVDADCYLDKKFLEINEEINYSYVNVWKVRNPINGLVYGHGGPKLFSRHLFNKKFSSVDMTFSLTKPQFVRVIDDVVGEHRFNWSAFSTWRTAFREVVKLKTAAIEMSEETAYRLGIWTSWADKKEPFWDYCLAGANAALKFVSTQLASSESNPFRKINDYRYLKQLMKESTR